MKGSVNRVTRDLKAGIITAAVNLGRNGDGEDGLVGYLEYLGWHHPRAFAGLLGKMLPLQINSDGPGNVSVSLNVTSIPSGSYLSPETIQKLQQPLQLDHAPIEQAEPEVENMVEVEVDVEPKPVDDGGVYLVRAPSRRRGPLND